MDYFQFLQALRRLEQARKNQPGLELESSISKAGTEPDQPCINAIDLSDSPEPGQLAKSLRALRKAGEDQRVLRTAALAASLGNSTLATYRQWAEALVDLHRYGEAIQVLRQGANRLDNNWTLRLRAGLILPAVPATQSEMNRAHARVHRVMRALPKLPLPGQPAELAALERALEPNFYLAYLGKPCVEEARAFGRFVQRIVQATYPEYDGIDLPPRLHVTTKIRVGYATSYASFHSVMKCVAGWLQHANRDVFELHLFPLETERDKMTTFLASIVDEFHDSTSDMEVAASQIRDAELDVLVYPEVGMDPLTMRLAALRLAPVQCATWGHPPTTGSPAIDYFLSSDKMEPENASDHYTERLVTLPGIGVCVPELTAAPSGKSRQDFGFSALEIVYLSPQSLFKYLPRHDEIFVRIAEAVDDATFVFVAGEFPAWTDTFRNRIYDTFIARGLDPEKHLRFIPPQSFDDFLRLNASCDVLLDTIGWSGCNTTLEALAQDLPVVTMPGELMRSRHSYAMLKQLAIEDTIASNLDDYVRIAIRLGKDRGWRNDIAHRIAGRRNQLFNDTRCVTSLEAFFRWAVGAQQPGDETLFKLWPAPDHTIPVRSRQSGAANGSDSLSKTGW
jgi:protein O-GlcNAc transferase